MTLQEIEERLKKHDYTYEMSDDFRYWKSGTADKEEITKMILEHLKANPDDFDLIVGLIIKYRQEYGTDFIGECKL